MALMKRATNKLYKAGLEHLEIHRYSAGYGIEDRRFSAQQGSLHDSVEAAIEAALEGERPTQIRVPNMICPFCECKFYLPEDKVKCICPDCSHELWIQTI